MGQGKAARPLRAAVAVASGIVAALLWPGPAAWAAGSVTASEADSFGGTYSVTISNSRASGTCSSGVCTDADVVWTWGTKGTSNANQGIRITCSDGTVLGTVGTDFWNITPHTETIQFSCPGTAHPVTWRAADWTGGATNGAVYGPSMPWPSDARWPTPSDWCSSADFADASAGWTSASGLTVRFKWRNASLPPSGWIVTNGAGTITYGTLPTTATVDGNPGYFWGKFAAASAPTSITITSGANASGAAGCSVTIGTIKQTDVAPGASTYGATDPETETETDCGWNPYCYTKAALHWAFVPSQESLEDLKDSWATLMDNRVPFAFLSIADSLVDDIVPDNACISACWPEWEIAGTQVLAYDSAAGEQLRAKRDFLQGAVFVIMLVPIGVAFFWSLMPVVGKGGGGDD